jgi:hypothetical protein
MKFIRLLLSFAFSLSIPGRSQDLDMEHRQFKVGPINYFGYGGLAVDKLRTVLPLHTGESVSFASFPMDALRQAVQETIGSPPTDVAIVCCDAEQRLLIYVGLSGTTSRALATHPAPTGQAHLDPEGLKLYDEDMAALQQAITHGKTEEDDSQGYAVSADPELKAVNLAMRSYALDRGPELIDVLRQSNDPKQRIAAAQLLGYSRSSSAQVEAPSQAVADPDETVRNNATRALEVLASSSHSEPLTMNAQPAIQMLFSGKWSDRNKAGLLLMRLTDTASPALLQTLRAQALEPLIEGASWTGDPGHSDLFLILLGRIAGLSKTALDDMVERNDVQAAVQAARAAKPRQ